MKNRVEVVSKILKIHDIDALLLTSSSNIFYITGFQLFSSERDAFCFVTREKIFVFTDSRYIGALRSNKKIEVINSGGRLKFFQELNHIVRHNRVEKIGFEKDSVLYQEYLDLRKNLKDIKLIGINHPLRAARLIKSDEEIKQIKKACSITDKAFEHTLKLIKKGVSEKNLAFELEAFIKQSGAELAFPSIVAFGKNSATPHHTSTNDRLTTNQLVLMDFGAKINGYCSDITRTVYFGEPDKKITNIYETVKTAQEKAVNILNTELVRASKVDSTAREYIISKKFPSIPHSVGHGIGIDVHEAPNINPLNNEVLKPGMVITIEPGIYLPKVGGVRREDTVLIFEKNVNILTRSTKDFIII